MSRVPDIILMKEDFDFIDQYCKTRDLPEGKGHKRNMAAFINEYKLFIELGKDFRGDEDE